MSAVCSDTASSRRRAYRVAIGIALVLAVLSMGAGLFTDDYLHFATLEGAETPGSALDLYNFGDGNPENMADFRAIGPHPWFVFPEFKLHFFRPLSCLTMWADHAVFGHWISGYHLHSGLWYVALTVVLMLLFRRVLPGGIGALALLLYVLDEGHVVPVGWWANRNALVATVFALLGLLAHLRWREDGWRPGLWWSLPCYALGFLGGETALGVMAYLGAYELLAAPGRFTKRVAALLPAVGLSVVYLAAYGAAGYGTFGSQEYINPLSEWRTFLGVFPERMLLMVGNLVLGIPPEAHLPGPAWVPGAIGVVLMAGVFGLIGRSLPEHERRALRWLIVGACIAGIPTLSASPSARVYILPSIGSAAALAIVLRHGWRLARTWRNAAWKLLTGYLITIHLVLSALVWPGAIVFSSVVTARMSDSIHAFAKQTQLAGKHLLAMSSNDPMYTIYVPFMLIYHGYERPAAWWCATQSSYRKSVTRRAVDTLEVELLDRSLLSKGFEAVMRRRDLKLRQDEQVDCGDLRVRVLETDENGVRRFEMRVAGSLDDKRYGMVLWDAEAEHFVSSPMPAVGETISQRK